MRVLIITDFTKPHHENNHDGGVEAFSVETWKLMNKYGFDCDILTTHDSILKDSGCENGNAYYLTFDSKDKIKADAEARLGRPVKTRYTKTHLKQLVDTLENLPSYDLVITSHFTTSLTREIVKAMPNSKIMHFMHRNMFSMFGPAWVQEQKDLKELHGNMTIVAVSEYTKRNLNRLVPNTVDDVIGLTYFTSDYILPNSMSAKQIVVYAGRISYTKRLEDIMEIYKDSEFTLVMIGAKQPTQKEQDWYDKYFDPTVAQYTNLKWVGSLSQSQLFRFIQSCGALVMPNHTMESFSLCTFEAQKLGIPVVCHVKHDDEAMSEYVVQGATGYCVNTNRMRKPQVRNTILEATRKAVNLNNENIRKYFEERYTNSNYITSIVKLGGLDG